MPKKEYTSLPQGYPVCEHSGCPMAATCLHQTAYATLMEREEYLRLINPSRCSKNESYSSSTRGARGDKTDVLKACFKFIIIHKKEK